MKMKCPDCNGKGWRDVYFVDPVCPTCKGKGTLPDPILRELKTLEKLFDKLFDTCREYREMIDDLQKRVKELEDRK